MIQPANHWLFQLANFSLFLSYLATDVLILRILLALGTLFFALWGGIVLSVSIDTVLWNGIFVIINTVQAVRIIYARRPIKFSMDEHEEIYRDIFEPVGVKRIEFKALIDEALQRSLKKGSVYIEEGNEIHSLSLLLRGKMSVKVKNKREFGGQPGGDLMNHLGPGDWIESPEWLTLLRSDAWAKKKKKKTRNPLRALYQKCCRAPRVEEENVEVIVEQESLRKIILVTVEAEEDSVFFTWPIESLMRRLGQFPELISPFVSVVGSDVAKKLFEQTGNVARNIREANVLRTLTKRNLITTETLEVLSKREEDFLAHFSQMTNTVSKEEWSQLINLGMWKRTRREGTVLIREGEEVPEVGIVHSGRLKVIRGEEEDEMHLYSLGSLHFVGSVEFMNARDESLSSVSICTEEPAEVLWWNVKNLHSFLDQHPHIQTAFMSLLAADVAFKAKTMEMSFVSGK